MKKRPLYIFTAALAVIMTLSLAMEADASWVKRKSREKSAGKKSGGTFSVSGIYTGSIDERMRYGGKNFWLTDDTMIYVLGSGFKERGIYVTDAHVMIYGDRKRGVPTIRTVLVRFRDAPISAHYTDPVVPAGAIPSDVNPSVGELSRDTPQ